MNGYLGADGTSIVLELGVYYISADNYYIHKKIGDYSDLTFLLPENLDAFVSIINQLNLTQEEIEAKQKNMKMKLRSN